MAARRDLVILPGSKATIADLAVLRAAAAAFGVVYPSIVVAAPGMQILIDLLPRLWSL